ncbi:uncharacterized protein JN550_009360 [Neoarthrinium moseri]|uniref:uncharacterized protein n=1 Tax=Neoarthrinium moseri TaxID=1658444 RepID=UPI001FDBDB66|nr:uncharacterized protein JN550_009360 [Neoarthrinium moseri]KAI1863862.1 hypothetical protein JN550_009360 [Neoarthrinium moseri]
MPPAPGGNSHALPSSRSRSAFEPLREAQDGEPVMGYSAVPVDGDWRDPYDIYDQPVDNDDSSETSSRLRSGHGKAHEVLPTNVQEVSSPANWQSSWRPFYLQRVVLLGFLVVMAIMVIALEVMFSLSVRRQGLVPAQSNLRYLWTYGPTTVIVILGAFWGRVEYETQLTAPWLRMEKDGKTSDALLLDYINMFSLSVPFRAIKKRDFKVAAASTISFLLVVEAVISTALFTLSPTQFPGTSVPVFMNTQFDDDPAKLQNPSELPFFGILGLTLDNMSYPEGCSEVYAYQTFNSTEPSALDITAVVDGLSLELDCQESDSALAGIEYGRLFQESSFKMWEVDWSKMQINHDGCRANLSLDTSMLIPSMDPSKAEGTTGSRHIMWLGSLRGFGTGQCGSTDPDSNRLLLMSAKLDYMYYNVTNTTWAGNAGNDVHMKTLNISSTSLFCAPRFNMVSLAVTKNSTGIQDISMPLNTSSKSISNVHPWVVVQDHLKTVPRGIFSATPPVMVGNTKVFGNDYFDAVMRTCGDDCNGESALLDGALLQRYLVKHYQQYAAFLFHQSFKSPAEITASGTATTVTNRLKVQSLACHLMVGLFVLIMAILVGFIISMPTNIFFPLEPGSIISYVIVSALALIGTPPSHVGGASKEGMAKEIRSWLGEPEKQGAGFFEKREEQLTTTGHLISGTPKFRFPTALRPYTRGPVYLFMLGCVATLEATLHLSWKNQGLGYVPDETYLHYAWTTLPAVVLSILGLFMSSVDIQSRILVPYHALSRGAWFDYLNLDLLRPLLPMALVQEFRIKNFAAFMGTIAALIASKFTIGSASLFHAEVFAASGSATLRSTSTIVVDHLYNLDGVISTSNLYTTALVLGSNLSYTPLIYEDLLIPSLTLDKDLAITSVPSQNLSSLIVQATVPALRPGMNCSLYPTSSISTGEFRNRQINQISVATYEGISVNITGQQCSWQFASGNWQAYTNNTATFAKNLTSEFYFGSGTFNDGVAVVPCSDDVLYIWGQYPGPGVSSPVSISAMGCNRTAESVDVEVTYVGADLQLDPANPPRPLEATAKMIPGRFNISDGGDDIFGVYYGNLASLTPPNDTLFDEFFGQLVTSRYAIPLTSLKDASQAEAVKDAIMFQHGVYAAQYIDMRHRVALNSSLTVFPALSSAAAGSDTGVYNATITNPWGSSRIVQDEVGTRILEVLLLIALVLSALSWALGPWKPVLPRSPTNIASVLALLSGGDLLEHLHGQDSMKEWHNLEELRAVLGDESRFWVGMGPPKSDGEKRFGIWLT